MSSDSLTVAVPCEVSGPVWSKRAAPRQSYEGLATSRKMDLRVESDSAWKMVAKPCKVSLAAVSKYLSVLEAAKLITREKRGSFQIVRLNARPMKDAERWLVYYERFWNRRLDAPQDLSKSEGREESNESRK